MKQMFIDKELLEQYDLKVVEEVFDRYGEVSLGINKKYPHLSSIVNKTFKAISKNELTFLRDKDWGNHKNKTKLSIQELKYLKEKKVIRVCSNPNWEPIEFTQNNEVQGITIDVLNIIKEKLHIEYDFIKTSSWSESQQFLKDQKCDILPSAIQNEERKNYANFTSPYLNYDLSIISTLDKPLVSDFESIASKIMSRKKGSGIIPKLQNLYPNLQIHETDSYLDSLNEVINKKAYFTLSTLPAFSYYKTKSGLKNLKIVGDSNLDLQLSIAVIKNDPVLLNILEKVLKSIPKSTYNLIQDKWSTTKIISETDWSLFFKISTVIIILTIFLIWHNNNLQKIVKIKTKDLHKQKEELELLIASFDKNVIFSRTDLKGNITHISDAFCKLSGYTQEEVFGKPHNMFKHPNMSDEVFHEIWESLKNELPITREIHNLAKDGTDYWLESKFTIDYNNKNEKIGYNCTRQNITDKKEVENLSKNLEKKVEERTLELEIAKKEVESIYKHTQDSIEYASLIQHSLIPKNEMFKKYFNEYLTIWHPKDVVGGDIYLFEELRSEDECLLMVVDCTGHGVPGAFVTMLVKAIERQIVATIKHNSEEIVSPGKLLGIFNRSMKHLLRQEDEFSISNAGFDGGIIYYNKKDNILKFSGAETPLFYTDKNNELQVIKGSRHSIGYRKCNPQFEFKEHTIETTKGMKFYLSTDGYLDQNGGKKGFPFGKKRFSNIINEYKDESFADQQEVFLEELHEYQGQEDRNDDVTLIAFEI